MREYWEQTGLEEGQTVPQAHEGEAQEQTLDKIRKVLLCYPNDPRRLTESIFVGHCGILFYAIKKHYKKFS